MKPKVNVRKDYSYAAKKGPPKYGAATEPRKTLYLVLRGPGVDMSKSAEENAELKAYAIKSRIKFKFLQAKSESEVIQFIKEANTWAAGIVVHLGDLEDSSGNIEQAIKKLLISTAEVRENGSYVEALKVLKAK